MVGATRTAQEVIAYEPDKDKTVTVTNIKDALKNLINDLKDSESSSAHRELDLFKAQDSIIKEIEKQIRYKKSELKDETNELKLKIQLKRFGSEGFKIEKQEMIQQIEGQITKLNLNGKNKRKINALNKDKAVIEKDIARIDVVLEAIGGQLTNDEAKHLILKKLYNIASTELEHYTNIELGELVLSVESLWSKYAISNQKIEESRTEVIDRLDGFLKNLGYLEIQS